MVSVDEYLSMSTRKRRALARRAIRGNEEEKRAYYELTNKLKVRVNTNLRALKRKSLNYGIQYNTVMMYAKSHGIKRERLSSAKELKFDIAEMNWQNEVAVTFLKSGWATVEKALEAESHRLSKLKESGVIPDSFKRERKSIAFLRWLGNEEVTATIDSFGRSHEIVEMSYDVFKERGRAGLKDLSRAFTEFLDHRVGFDEAMERIGVNIENYIRARN